MKDFTFATESSLFRRIVSSPQELGYSSAQENYEDTSACVAASLYVAGRVLL